MIFLPIVNRELRVRARQPLMYWLRTALAAFALLLCFIISLATWGMGGQPDGQAVFRGLAFMGEALALCAGLFTADCISRERREGTLGLLFLTDLKGHDILLGKAASIGLTLALALLGLAPCLSIPLLAGGVRGVEILQAMAAISVALVYSLSLGLWVSARASSTQHPIRRAAIYMIGWTLVPLLAMLAADFPLAKFFAAFSPAYPFVWMTLSKAPAADLLVSIAVLLLFSAGYVVSAGRRLAGRWQEEEPETAAAVAPRRGVKVAASLAAQPITWLIERQPGFRSAFRWATALIVLHLLATRIIPHFASWISMGLHYVLPAAANGLIAWAACRWLVEARRTGELELLLDTPTGASELVRQHWRAVWRGARWPLLVLVVGQVVYYLWVLWEMQPRAASMEFIWWFYVWQMLLSPISAVIEMLALCWVAMRFGARAMRPAAAVARTLLWVLASSWLMHGLFIGLINLVIQWLAVGRFMQFSYFFAFGMVYLVIIAKNIILWRWAKRSLSRPHFLAG